MTSMDTMGLAALATEMATTRTMQAAQIGVMKIAMNQQGAGALQLLQALPIPAVNPPNLGNTIDLFA